ILREGERGPAEDFGFRTGALGLGAGRFGRNQMLGNLRVGKFFRRNVLCRSVELPDGIIFSQYRGRLYPHPADLAVRPNDAKLLVEMSGMNGVLEFRAHMSAVIRVNQVFI